MSRPDTIGRTMREHGTWLLPLGSSAGVRSTPFFGRLREAVQPCGALAGPLFNDLSGAHSHRLLRESRSLMEIACRGSCRIPASPRVSRRASSALGGMMRSSDREYFRERGAVERALAEATDDLKAAAIHHELAKRYEMLAREEKRPILHILAASPSPTDRT